MLRHDAPVGVSLLMPLPSTLISLDSPGRAAAALQACKTILARETLQDPD